MFTFKVFSLPLLFLALSTHAAKDNNKKQAGNKVVSVSQVTMKNGCPSLMSANVRSGLCQDHGDCGALSKTGFPAKTEMCCVAFTFPYCGVPSACNPYLKCKNIAEGSAPVTLPSSEVSDEEIALTNAILSACPDNATSIEDCPLVVSDDDLSSSVWVSTTIPLAICAFAGISAFIGMQ